MMAGPIEEDIRIVRFFEPRELKKHTAHGNGKIPSWDFAKEAVFSSSDSEDTLTKLKPRRGPQRRQQYWHRCNQDIGIQQHQKQLLLKRHFSVINKLRSLIMANNPESIQLRNIVQIVSITTSIPSLSTCS